MTADDAGSVQGGVLRTLARDGDDFDAAHAALRLVHVGETAWCWCMRLAPTRLSVW
jgi:hypothetical protein